MSCTPNSLGGVVYRYYAEDVSHSRGEVDSWPLLHKRTSSGQVEILCRSTSVYNRVILPQYLLGIWNAPVGFLFCPSTFVILLCTVLRLKRDASKRSNI